MIEFDVIFEGARVPTWLREFERAPAEAIEDLLVGRADLGLLSAEEPSTLLLDWLAGIGDRDGFTREIDEALASWIDRSWGNPTLESANSSASLTAVAWCRAADVIALDERLDKSADCLRQRVIKDRRFLNALHEGRGRDPMARAWLAISRHQQDRSLVDQWWRLCSLPPDEPWYRGAYGIHGMRGLPPADESKKGVFAEEVAEGLAMLACALWRRKEGRWLQDNLAANEFARTARMTMAAYPFPKDWQAFWRQAVDRYDNPAPRDWVKKIVRLTDGVKPQRAGKNKSGERQIRTKQSARPDSQWPTVAKRIAGALAHADWSVRGDAEQLLDSQTRFAEATGNTYFAVRTACNFAGKVRKQRPGLALKWAELARRLEPWNEYAWTTSSTALQALGRNREALTFALKAVERFPEDVVARTGLAEVLKAQGRFDEAESVYRDTIERFPENDFARNGLAEVFKAQGRFEEAESVYRDTIERFPENVVARTGLAEVLKAQRRFDEAESVYRDTIERFPENDVAPSGLAEVLKAQQRFDEAESLYRDTIERFPEDDVTRSGLANLLKGMGRFEEAAVLLAELSKTIEESDEAMPTGPGEPTTIPEIHEAVHVPKPTDRVLLEPTDMRTNGAKPTRSEEPFVIPGTHEAVDGPKSTDSVPPELTDVPAASAEDGAEASPGLSADDMSILLADAYLLRRWHSQAVRSVGQESTGAIHDRARELLENLMPLIGRDSRSASEAGLITLAQGDLEQAVQFLLQASERFRGSVRVHYALARAQRELARVQRRALSAEAEMEVIVPWRRLSRVDEHCRPVQLLGEGRAWLTLTDGATVEEHAREAFGRLGHWLRRQIEPADREIAPNATAMERIRDQFAPREGADRFFGWWAREVQTYVFGEEPVSRAEDLAQLAPIRERIARHASVLDQIEEECVARFDRA